MIIGANKVAVDGSPEAMLARGGFTCDPRQVLRLHYGSSLYILQQIKGAMPKLCRGVSHYGYTCSCAFVLAMR